MHDAKRHEEGLLPFPLASPCDPLAPAGAGLDINIPKDFGVPDMDRSDDGRRGKHWEHRGYGCPSLLAERDPGVVRVRQKDTYVLTVTVTAPAHDVARFLSPTEGFSTKCTIPSESS